MLRLRAPLASGVLAALVYLPALGGSLVWDDEIVATRQMAVFQGPRDVFFPPRDIPQWSPDYYRPLVVASYLLDQALFGRGATRGPHAMVMLYHALATMLVAALASRAVRDPARDSSARENLAALGAGALFAVHPIHTESVCWITGRSDTLATLFACLSLALALRARDGARPGLAFWTAGAALAYLGALLCKEVALSVLLLLGPFLALVRPLPGARKAAIPSLAVAFLLATAAYFFLRESAGTSYGKGSIQASPAQLEHALLALAFYLKKIVWPPPQSVYVGSMGDGSLARLGSALFLAAWLGAGAVLALRGRRAVLLGAVWFCIALLPSLAVAVRSIAEVPLAERYLYLPSAGAALSFGGALVLARGRLARAVSAVAVLLLAVCARATVERCKVWRDDLALWTSTVEASPLLALPWHQLGLARQQRGLHEEAIDAFQRALSLADGGSTRARIHNNLGRSFVELGRLKQGEAELRKAMELWPEYEMPPFNLAMVARIRERAARQATGQPDCTLLAAAQSLLENAIEKSPSFLQAREEAIRCALDLATCVHGKGEPQAAREILLRARESLAEYEALDLGRSSSSERALMFDEALQKLERELQQPPAANQ